MNTNIIDSDTPLTEAKGHRDSLQSILAALGKGKITEFVRGLWRPLHIHRPCAQSPVYGQGAFERVSEKVARAISRHQSRSRFYLRERE